MRRPDDRGRSIEPDQHGVVAEYGDGTDGHGMASVVDRYEVPHVLGVGRRPQRANLSWAPSREPRISGSRQTTPRNWRRGSPPRPASGRASCWCAASFVDRPTGRPDHPVPGRARPGPTGRQRWEPRSARSHGKQSGRLRGGDTDFDNRESGHGEQDPQQGRRAPGEGLEQASEARPAEVAGDVGRGPEQRIAVHERGGMGNRREMRRDHGWPEEGRRRRCLVGIHERLTCPGSPLTSGCCPMMHFCPFNLVVRAQRPP